MGDALDELAVFWAYQKEESKIKRANNRQQSPEILADRGVRFESKNNGVHLVVHGREEVIDFWPGTGKFIARKSGKTGRGVFNVLKLCEVCRE